MGVQIECYVVQSFYEPEDTLFDAEVENFEFEFNCDFNEVELDVSVLTGIDNDIDTMLQETGALSCHTLPSGPIRLPLTALEQHLSPQQMKELDIADNVLFEDFPVNEAITNTLYNLDVTVLVGLVSDMSNGGASILVDTYRRLYPPRSLAPVSSFVYPRQFPSQLHKQLSMDSGDSNVALFWPALAAVAINVNSLRANVNSATVLALPRLLMLPVSEYNFLTSDSDICCIQDFMATVKSDAVALPSRFETLLYEQALHELQNPLLSSLSFLLSLLCPEILLNRASDCSLKLTSRLIATESVVASFRSIVSLMGDDREQHVVVTFHDCRLSQARAEYLIQRLRVYPDRVDESVTKSFSGRRINDHHRALLSLATMHADSLNVIDTTRIVPVCTSEKCITITANKSLVRAVRMCYAGLPMLEHSARGEIMWIFRFTALTGGHLGRMRSIDDFVSNSAKSHEFR